MSIESTILSDLSAAWGDITGAVEADALSAWGFFKPFITQLEANQWTILSGLFSEAASDVGTGNISDLLTVVLNKAVSEEFAWVQTLETDVLTAIAAMFKAKVVASSNVSTS